MPPENTAPVSDIDRHFRRLTWAGALIIAVAAGIVYAGKAGDDRSAFVRWRHQVHDFWDGVNIYDTIMFPNPPIMPLTLSPFMALPKVPGALCWFSFKVALAAASVWICFGWIRPEGRAIPSWVQAGILFFSLRPFLGDLHHGNINLVILFLIVACLQAWRRGYDVLAGVLLALAISYKVTPALFVPYFMYKRSWRTVTATCLGIGLFLLIIPGAILGPRFNGECLAMWWHRILSPYVTKGIVGDGEINQSLVGVLSRLLTAHKPSAGPYDAHLQVNFVSWPPAMVRPLIKVISLGVVAALAFFCRTKAERRDDPRLIGEFALVVLTMLFVSERSWKHHYVTLLLPYTYLMYQFAFGKLSLGRRVVIAAAIWSSMFLMATTSSELGGQFAHGQGHKLAQAYGMFLWAGVLLYGATAWRVWADRDGASRHAVAQADGSARADRGLPAPHFRGSSRPAVSS